MWVIARARPFSRSHILSHYPFHAQHFMKLFSRFLEARSRPPIDWKQVEPIDPALIQDFEKIPPCPDDQVRGDARF